MEFALGLSVGCCLPHLLHHRIHLPQHRFSFCYPVYLSPHRGRNCDSRMWNTQWLRWLLRESSAIEWTRRLRDVDFWSWNMRGCVLMIPERIDLQWRLCWGYKTRISISQLIPVYKSLIKSYTYFSGFSSVHMNGWLGLPMSLEWPIPMRIGPPAIGRPAS